MPQRFSYDTRLLFDHTFYDELFTNIQLERMDDLLRKLATIKSSSSHCKPDQGKLSQIQNYILSSELKELEAVHSKFPDPTITHGIGAEAYDAAYLADEPILRNLSFAQVITTVYPYQCSLLTSVKRKEEYYNHKKYRDKSINFNLEYSVQLYSGNDAYKLIDVYHSKYMDALTP